MSGYSGSSRHKSGFGFMKVLFVIEIYGGACTSGAAAYVANLSRELRKRGHKVIVVACEYDPLPDEEVEDGIDVIKTALWRLPFEIMKAKPQVVHVNIYRSNLSGLAYALLSVLRIPFVITTHGIFPPRSPAHRMMQRVFDITAGRLGLHSAKTVIALTSAQREQLLGMGVAEERIRVIPNAIDLRKFENEYDSRVVRRKYKLPREVVLYVGRFDWNKGVGYLVAAMCEVKRCFPGSKLALVGRTHNIWAWERIEQTVKQLRGMIRRMGLQDSVSFLGLVPDDDLPAIYACSKVLVLPSRYEELPTVILEALASRIPVITTNTWGTEGIVMNGRTGLIVAYGNHEELAKAITHILSNDEVSRRMGRNGHRLVSTNYSFSLVAEKMIVLYRSLSSGEGD